MSRFKTELCNNLMELGSCKYGDRCHYAHGAHELRQVSRRHPKYRTEKCKNFELTGKCPFGPRCSYVHPRPDLDSMIEQLTRYVQHTKAPKPDSEDDEDESNITNLFPRTATCSSLLSQCESSTSCNSNQHYFNIDDINKENQLVADYSINSRPISEDNLEKSGGTNANYYETPFVFNRQQPSILETHKPLVAITHNQQEQQQQQRRPQLASSTLTIQRPQQPQRIAMRALSSNSQSQFIDQTDATKSSIAPPSPSSPSSSSASPFDKTITTGNLFGIDNPLSDYFRNTSKTTEENPMLPNKQFYTRF